MAIEQRAFPLEWMEQYRLSDNWWNGSYSPIRAGSNEGYISFLGTPAGVREAIVTSKTPAKVYLRLYFYYGGDFLVGKHQLSSRPTQSTKPYHLALTGWEFTPDVNQYQDYNFTGIIRDDLVSGKYQGVTIWNNKGTPASECWGVIDNPYRAYWVVEGDWNVPPERPRLDYPTFGISVNQELTVRWTPPVNETNPNSLSYDVAISDDNGTTWKNYPKATTNGITSYKINTYNMSQTRKAIVAIRAFDGEFYSEWNYSDWFIIFHDVAPKAPTGTTPVVGSTIDRTAINTFSWKADPKAIQMGYQFRWRTVYSGGNRGSWNYVPNSTSFVNSTSQHYNMPSSTLPLGMFEWSVKTTDDFNLQSSWTTEQLAISANPSNAPNMVYPTYAVVHPQATMVVEWTSVEQLQFELFLKNPGGVTLWSTTGTTERSVRLNYTLITNEAYYIQLRVNSSGVWSSFVRTDFSVNFATPAIPIIQRVEEAGSGVTNVVYNQGELGINLPPITEDGVTFANDWERRGNVSLSRIVPVDATSYKVNVSDLTAGNNFAGVSIYLDATQIPIVAGATYEVVGFSDNNGLRGIVWFYDANGNDIGSTADPAGQVAGSGAKSEVYASRVAPANVAKVRVVFDNVYGTPMSGGANVTVSGIQLRITSPVATNLIDCYRREYTLTGNAEWELIAGNPVVSSIDTGNLVPRFTDSSWVRHAQTTIMTPYKMRIQAPAATFLESYVYIPVKAGQQYTLIGLSSGWYIRPQTNTGASTGAEMVGGVQYKVFTTPTGTERLMFVASNNSTNDTYFIQPMLLKGNFPQSAPFQPRPLDGIRGGFLDYTPASQTLYEYKLVAWNLVNNTKSESPPRQFMHTFNETIVQDVDSITDLHFLTMVTDRDSSTEVDSALQRFVGRKDPVREYGENETTELSIEWEVDTWFEAKQVSDLLNKREVYLYRDGSGRKMFVSTDKVNMKDKQISGFVMSCEFTKTHYDTDNITT